MLNISQNIYRFPTIHINDVIDSNAGKELLNNDVSGLVINDFLIKEEIQLIIAGFRAIEQQSLIKINKGFTSYPISFAQFTQGIMNGNVDETEYYESADKFRKQFAANFGVDIEGKIKALSSLLLKGITLEVPYDFGKKGCFMPYNFRELFPGQGELKLHCENLFFEQFPLFFKKIGHLVSRKNDFSFFIVLQKAEQGGELSLYSQKWDPNPKQPFAEVGDTNNYVMEIESKQPNKQYINPEEGSLVLFSGGDIWHKVELIGGAKSRITIGGFISSGVDERRMYMWS